MTDFPARRALPAIAERLIAPFAEGDPLAGELAAICAEAFDFPAPVVPLERARGRRRRARVVSWPDLRVQGFRRALHWPPRSSACTARAGSKVTILVATSGDTGGAVAAAFHRRPWVDVVLLYPDGLVSPRQAQQLACWGDNVRTFAVRGTFDDCQRMVKEAFQDRALSAAHGLSSANSINVGRLLPQMVYYAAASLEVWHREGRKANFIVPSGNLGNVTAGVWAREARTADRRHRARDQREPRGDGVPRRRRLAPARERADAGLGDGRRQSVEHGAPARAVSGSARRPACPRGWSPTNRFARPSGRTPRRSTTSGIRMARPRRTCITTLLTDRAGEPVGAARDGAPGQVQRDRGAADRTGHRGATGSGAPVAPAAAGGAPGADARRVTRAALTGAHRQPASP